MELDKAELLLAEAGWVVKSQGTLTRIEVNLGKIRLLRDLKLAQYKTTPHQHRRNAN